ncbi:hypothetical protein AURDEDRAFT_177208 [Auricularia subglabra TFB-10046 SS5]|uniref:DUF6532 domain-containing protein n=1 Tax=Auricularia subglabra (strain TFB-10046 / SS5) TaxID=717982 RepID=J0WMX5_AURST|nr:hypothetical protein AURDEDRAFT_177208 [Auricularia subglabra TFB-10046 SS5]
MQDRIVQSAANEDELNAKLGKKSRKAGKENRNQTVEERRAASRAQITLESVPQRKTATVKPRAPGTLAHIRETTKQAQSQPNVPTTPALLGAPATPRPQGTSVRSTGTPDASNAAPAPTVKAGTKRAASPGLEQPVSRRRRGTAPAPPKPHVRDGDLPDRERLFVRRAYRALRALASIDPFTTKAVNDIKVNNAIGYARRKEPKDQDLEVTATMRQLLRGDVKTAAKTLFPVHYGLHTTRNQKLVAKNVSTVKLLREGDGFIYKNFKERLLMYQHPCISDCINAVWFSGRDKEGPEFDKIFNPNGEGIKPETIALVLAALYNCVKEWETGTRQSIKFRDDTFRSDYVVLLDGLRAYEKGNPALFLKLRRKLYKAGIAHAGVILDTSAHSRPSAADFARAAAFDTISDDSDDDGQAPGHGDDHDMDLDDPAPALPAGALADKDARVEPVADDAEDAPFAGDDQDDVAPPRARRRTRAVAPEDEDDDHQAAAGVDPKPVEVDRLQALEDELLAGMSMTPADREAYFAMLMDEREFYLEMSPDDREIFLEMSPEEREQWMNDCEADEDGDDDTSGNTAGAPSGSRASGSITFLVDDQDISSSSSEDE